MWRSLELNFSSPFKMTSFWRCRYSLIFFFFWPTLFIYFYLLLLIFFLFMSNEIIETFFIFSCFGLLRQMKHQFFFFFFYLLYLFIFIYFCWFSPFLCLTKLLRHFFYFFLFWTIEINETSKIFFFFPIIRKEVAIENVEHLKETFKVIFN